jgi:LuxR family maltose regulon positive regulatory protein
MDMVPEILLSTKFDRPPPRSSLIARPRLTERLSHGQNKSLTLISAPAGFGKTTLLSEWLTQTQQSIAWLSLDDGDDDSTRFWGYVIAALQLLQPNLGENARALLQTPQPPPAPAFLTSLINDLAEFPDDFSLVLDDYHVVSDPAIHAALAYLIDHQPPNMHVILTTRADPPLPLARLRSHDQLTELRANDLRFTPDEATAFLAEAMGLNLSAEEVAALEARTEGWIAGLQIAALSMQGHEDIRGFIQAFSGSHRHILGYLAEEVLNQRPKGTLNFLLQTSVLDRLYGPLCDAVTGESGGQAVLENLANANLFITPLDNEGRWFRYHPLFAEVLQARLQRTWPDRLPELHRRAGNWHAGQYMTDGAVRHALARADLAEAARLIEGVAGQMLRRGASISLIRWLDALPEETVRARPRLCLARGWTNIWGPVFDLESVDEWVQSALQAASANQSPDAELAGETAALQAMAAAIRTDVPRTLEHCHQALDQLLPDSPWRSVMAFCLGSAYFSAGNVAEAAPSLSEALRLSQAGGAYYIWLIAANFLADIEVLQGRLGRATEMYEQVLAWAGHGVPHKGALMAHASLANVLCEQNQLEAALVHFQLGSAQLDLVGGPAAALWLNRALARVHQANGNWADAREALDRAYQTGRSTRTTHVMRQAAALRARLQLALGDLGAAEAWGQSSGLSSGDQAISHPGLSEVEYLTFARLLSAQGRRAEALSLLDRLLESAEADGRNGSEIAISVLQSLVYQAQGNLPGAHARLEHALALAAPEGYLRVFLDEGEAMRALISQWRAQARLQLGLTIGQQGCLAYAERLMAAFGAPQTAGPPSQAAGLGEPLSERELDVLRLIAAGHSNKEIAEMLVIAVSTVKSHINSLYAKLGTQRRAQAILIARQRALLLD